MSRRQMAADLYEFLEEYSAGGECISAGCFFWWGAYYMLFELPPDHNPVLHVVSAGFLGGLILILLGAVHVLAIFPCLARLLGLPVFSRWYRIAIRKVGSSIGLTLRSGVFLSAALAAPYLSSGWTMALSQIPGMILLVVAVARRPPSYRDSLWARD